MSLSIASSNGISSLTVLVLVRLHQCNTANVWQVGVDMRNQTCKACGYRDKLDFHVPDDLWAQVVPAEYVNRVVCLACFDSFAAERRVDYATRLSLSLWFAGDAATFEFRVSSAISG